jgi:hypothetical protein
VREYQRDLDNELMAEHGGSTKESVDVNAAMRGMVPPSMIQAGRSLADVAHEMMAVVSRGEAARRAEEEAAKQAAEAPAEAAAEPVAEAPAEPVAQAPAEEAAPDAEAGN